MEDVNGDYIRGQEDGYLVKEGTKDGTGEAAVLGQPLVEKTYRVIHDTFRLGREDEGQQGYAVSSYPPVVTTPAAYVPQAAGICWPGFWGFPVCGWFIWDVWEICCFLWRSHGLP